jgi:hypothetical protein
MIVTSLSSKRTWLPLKLPRAYIPKRRALKILLWRVQLQPILAPSSEEDEGKELDVLGLQLCMCKLACLLVCMF